jgi:hypothetical protein
LATSAVSLQPLSHGAQIADAVRNERTSRLSLITGLTFLAVAIEGYHPYAEDGGLYAAGVERLLDPTLFPHWSSFVLAPMRVSAFAPALAALVRISGLSFPAVLVLVHLATIWATLYAAYRVAGHCWQSLRARIGAVVLLACWIGLPVAGTSLQIMDPYVTARSFSTPCALFALLAVLQATSQSHVDRRSRWLLLCAGSLTLAFAMHPLMAGYAVAATCLLACQRSPSRRIQVAGTLACCGAAMAFAALLQHLAAPESSAYIQAALTRAYWFPAKWAWYELAGLVAPLAILGFATLPRDRCLVQSHSTGEPDIPVPALAALSRMAIVFGCTVILIAVLYARPESSTHLIARLQPLRAFQLVYIVMILTLGALLGQRVLCRGVGRWMAAVLLLGGSVFFAERAAFPSSRHIQLSGVDGANPWIQSFAWVRAHTPKDALFALDPDYIHAPLEDGQCFRAIAQRSALPDFSKDGGEASIAPQLAESWQAGLRAQQNLNSESLRLYRNSTSASALRAIGVSWVILRAGARTDLNCPYSNTTAKVCRIG